MEKVAKKPKIIYERLSALIENPKSELVYSNEFELLIAVMLSAQCTDKRVNKVTSELFKVCKTPKDYVDLGVQALEEYIKSVNFFHNKAKNIVSACKDLVERFGGVVPKTHDELTSLAGVGNKTANVVLAVAFGQQAFAVDTHILRVSGRLGLTETKNPTACEKDLKVAFKDFDFPTTHHLLLLFGRYYCTARNPKCSSCVLLDLCKYAKNRDIKPKISE